MRLEARGGGDARRGAHLLDVLGAGVADLQMFVQTLDVLWRELAVEIVGDDLHDLLAADPAGHRAHARYASNSARTLERARCSSTRWLPSLSSSAWLTSAGSQPSTSRSTITSCWRGGSVAIASRTFSSVSAASRRSSGHATGGADQPPG